MYYDAMRREYCTLFDSRYLFRAVAMHDSLLQHSPAFHLTVFCFDDLAKEVMDRLALPNVETVSLAQLESHDDELRSAKDARSLREYMWTAYPALPLYIFATRPEVHEVTYVDADLLFFAGPDSLFEEMNDASVLITPHRFSREYEMHKVNGIYNSGFFTFRRDSRGMSCLEWWHERCVEWCYDRVEDGKWSDQRYLDDWPERFEGVRVLQHKGGGLAPWNITQYRLRRANGGVLVDTEPLIFYHYHGFDLREHGNHDWKPPGYYISAENRRLVYVPYLEALDRAIATVHTKMPDFSEGFAPTPTAGARGRVLLRSLRARLRRRWALTRALEHPGSS